MGRSHHGICRRTSTHKYDLFSKMIYIMEVVGGGKGGYSKKNYFLIRLRAARSRRCSSNCAWLSNWRVAQTKCQAALEGKCEKLSTRCPNPLASTKYNFHLAIEALGSGEQCSRALVQRSKIGEHWYALLRLREYGRRQRGSDAS